MEIKELMNRSAQPGRVEWIGLRPGKRQELQAVQEVEVSGADGLLGDHYGGRSGKRQVTLIQAEHLRAVAGMLGVESVDPRLTRRNIVVSGLNLLSLQNRRFRIGDEVILEGTGLCHPCSRMEENLGQGGYNAMRGHGGLTARVIRGGRIGLGDEVVMQEAVEEAE